MSTLQIHLGLGSSAAQISTHLTPQRSIYRPWRSLGQSTSHAPVSAAAQRPVVQVFAHTPGQIDWVGRVSAALEHVHEQTNMAPSSLDVSLGPSLAWVGVVDIAADSVRAGLSQQDRDAFVAAWIASQWQQDPAQGIVRTQPIAHTHRLLVSWIPKSVLADVQTACSRHSVTLNRCQPRLVERLARWAREMGPRSTGFVAAAVEQSAAAGMEPLVELTAMDPLGPLAVLRMWCPTGINTQATSAVRPLLVRLATQYGLACPDVPQLSIWPDGLADGGHP